MIIKNKKELTITKLRHQALDIIEAGIESVLPSNIMTKALKFDPGHKVLSVKKSHYDISQGRIFVIGGGKASGAMAQNLEKIIPPKLITTGIVNCKSCDYQTKKIKIIEAGSPIPDQRGVAGVKKMLALKKKYSIDKNDLVICLISGGGSALMPCPAKGISLNDKKKITKLLIESGAKIQEINAIRKHLSLVKGGHLGHCFYPTTVISLIISDVIGNDLDVIASGPTVADPSTYSKAYNVLKKYSLLSKVSKSVVKVLKKGMAGKIKETPKKLDNCHNYIIGDNGLALKAMYEKAKKLGLKPYVVTAKQTGDPIKMARLRAKEILKGKYGKYDVLLIGGETTPKLPKKHGKGGRNQHYAATSLLTLKDYPSDWVVASIGTDGSDFLPDVAGAIVDKNSLTTTVKKKINIQKYLDKFDSNTLLKKIGHSLIVTGNTGTNVCDVIVYILL